MLQAQHVRLAQLDHPTNQRSLTARNYGSAIKASGKYMAQLNTTLPTKSLLSQWRDDMLAGRTDDKGTVMAVRSVNARLAGARKLLRAMADDVTDIQMKFILNDWAKVEDAKATVVQDNPKRIMVAA